MASDDTDDFDLERIHVWPMDHYNMYGTGLVHFRVTEGRIVEDLYLTADECRTLSARLLAAADQTEKFEPTPNYKPGDWPETEGAPDEHAPGVVGSAHPAPDR